MNVITYQTRPIDQWPGQFTRQRKRSPFRAGWGDTMRLLDDELRHLKASGVVVLMALTPGEIRLDGRPRADARPQHPGVILCFDGAGGPMRFPCDRFDDWADNVRAIALALEALRKVDRYGVTSRGEQYTGWAALPAPDATNAKQDAINFIRKIIGWSGGGPFASPEQAKAAIREAEKLTHPDRGGDPEKFKQVQAARRILLGA